MTTILSTVADIKMLNILQRNQPLSLSLESSDAV